MNVWDVLILLGLALAVGMAVLAILRDRRQGKGCSGNCGSCGKACK